MPRARLGALLSALLLLLAACGNDKPEHGLKRKGFESAPKGDGIEVAFALTDGEVYKANVALEMDVRQVAIKDGRPNETTAAGTAVLGITWTIRKPREEVDATSNVVMRYIEAQGDHAEAVLAGEPVEGTFRHGSDGRTVPRSLQLKGGRTEEQIRAQNMLVSLLLGGFAGSYSWVPPRAVRVGEAWPLEAFIKPRAVDEVKRYARETGLATPQPTFTGTGTLHGIVEEDGERWLDVEIEALIEVSGTVSKGTERGRVSLGDRFRGRAMISASRGIPKSFDVTHTRRLRGSGGLAAGEMDVRSTLRGQVVHTLPSK